MTTHLHLVPRTKTCGTTLLLPVSPLPFTCHYCAGGDRHCLQNICLSVATEYKLDCTYGQSFLLLQTKLGGGKVTDAIDAFQDGRQPFPHVALTIPTIHPAQSA